MKKDNLLQAFIFLFTMLATGIYSSCGDDKVVGDEVDPTEIKSVNVDYQVSLSQTWYDYYTVEITYSDVNGVEHTETITSDWTYQATTGAEKAPKTYLCSVVARPKSPSPSVESGKVYSFSKDVSFEVEAICDDGGVSVDLGYSSSTSNTLSIAADKMAGFLSSERSIYDFSYEME